ncbi:unknown [Ruminococcus sp. CAG:382]|nr:unknown [Ruminococcus sp. CAG:382]
MIVTIAGSPSGMAATARLTLVRNISAGGNPLISDTAKITRHITSAALPSTVPVFARRF